MGACAWRSENLSPLTTISLAFSTQGSRKGRHRRSVPRTNSLVRHQRRDIQHETLHRLQELIKVAVAVEIELEGIEAGFLTIAQQIAGHFGRCTVAHWPLAARRRRIAGDCADLDTEAHACGDRHAPDLLARLAQSGLPLDQFRNGQRGRLPQRGKARRPAQCRIAGTANPYRGMWLLHRLGANMHVGKRKEPTGEGDLAWRPTGLPEAQIFVGARPPLVEWHAERRKFKFVPADTNTGNQSTA